MNKRDQLVVGKWLKIALDAQGVGVHKTAKDLGHIHHKFYRHINDQSHLNAHSLAEVFRLYPTMNARFVLTGEGEPIINLARQN